MSLDIRLPMTRCFRRGAVPWPITSHTPQRQLQEPSTDDPQGPCSGMDMLRYSPWAMMLLPPSALPSLTNIVATPSSPHLALPLPLFCPVLAFDLTHCSGSFLVKTRPKHH